MAVLNTEIDDDLKHRAKVVAAERQEPLKAFVARAIRRELERHEAEKRAGGR